MISNQINSILRIDSSSIHDQSITRRLGDEVVRRIKHRHPDADVTERDLASGIGFLSENWIQANMTSPAERNREQQEILAGSDELVRELDSADVILVTAPVYNFSVPAVLKAWIDMVCRSQRTFRYTKNGPVGLLKDRPVYLVMASGGVPFGSPADFASGYLRHILGFIGIQDVRPVYAEATNSNSSGSEKAALDMLGQWLPLEATTTAVA